MKVTARFDDETVIAASSPSELPAFEGADRVTLLPCSTMTERHWPAWATAWNCLDEVGLRYRFELGDQSYARDLAENIRWAM